MDKMIAFCGLDCAQCPAYMATQTNDQGLKESTLAKWRVEYDSPEMTIDAITCDGCTSAGRHGGYCGACPIRSCAVEKAVVNCGRCADFGCQKLNDFIAHIPDARANLEAFRLQS